MDILVAWFSHNQLSLQQYFFDVLIAIAIVYLGKLIAKLLRKAVCRLLQHKNIDQAVISFVGSIVFTLVFFVAIIAAISHLGFNTTSLVAIVGAAGLAVGFALQGSLSNFASGVIIIILKPFKSGDYVEVGGVAGTVEEIHLFATKLITVDNKAVIIPNGTITSDTITNYSAKPTRRIDLLIGVSYQADLAVTKQVLHKITSEHALVLAEPGTNIAVSELADNSVNLVVRPWVKTQNYWPVYFDLMEQIKLALDEAGIEIPYPQLSVHISKEDQHE